MTRRIVKTFTLDPWHVIALAVVKNESALVREALNLFLATKHETPPADMAQSGASQIGIRPSVNSITTKVVVGEHGVYSYPDDTPIQAGGDDGR